MLVRKKNPASNAPSTDDTPLHAILRNAYFLEQILTFIASQHPNDIAAMAKTTNQNGLTPLDYIPLLNLEFGEEIDVAKALFVILNSAPYKPMNEPLSVDSILQSYYPIDRQLQEHLRLACEGANFARKTIQASTTHPDYNQLNRSQQADIAKSINEMRKLYGSNTSPEELYRLCEQFKVGNCHELAFCVIHFLMTQASKPLNANIITVANGDHTFVMFDSEPLPNPNDYFNEHSSAVFCDPWSGQVGRYIQQDLSQSLGHYSHFGISSLGSLNLVSTLNLSFHQLSIQASFKITPQPPIKRPDHLGFFRQAKQTFTSLFGRDTTNKPSL